MDLIITISDIQVYRPGSYLPERMDTYINEAQENDLRPVLGDALYYDFLLKYKDSLATEYTAYQALLNEGTYTYNAVTISYPGLKPALCYFTLARYTRSNPVNNTSYGVNFKTNPQSTPVDSKTLSYTAGGLTDVAESYSLRITQFIQTMISNYPLYNRSYQQPVNKGGLNFFKG